MRIFIIAISLILLCGCVEQKLNSSSDEVLKLDFETTPNDKIAEFKEGSKTIYLNRKYIEHIEWFGGEDK